MQVSVLASGSTGNVSLLTTRQHKILMDAGLSGKKIKNLLVEVGVDINEIDMAFLSHDHSDHSSGLGGLMRRYPKIDAFANIGTWNYLLDTNKIGKLPVEQINTIEPGQALLDVVTPKTKHIFLAHRSQHNNTEYLAHDTAEEMLVQGDASLDSDVKIIDADPQKPTSLVKI